MRYLVKITGLHSVLSNNTGMYCQMGFNLSLAIYPSKMGTIIMKSAVKEY